MASLDSDEEDLRAVHRALNGDAQAFRAIVLKYGDRMLSFCRSRSPSGEEAADAAQDTFLRAFRSLRSFQVGSSFASWLFSIAANRSRTAWTRRFAELLKTRRAEAEAVAAPPNPEDDALRRVEAERIRAAVSDLPRELRIAIELYYFAELSVSETAQSLDIGEEAVKSRLFRARKKLRERLADPQPNVPFRGTSR